ncbi:MAG: hypothetical protein AB7O28_06140 [Vicinamibacterales bacterium]
MANRHLRGLSPDDIFERWKERFERVQLELTHLFEMRRKFRDIEAMFTENARLNATGSQAWDWLLTLWGRDAVMAIRRELDDDTNVISLGTLLDEMAERPDVVTRRRYLAFIPADKLWLVEANDREFTRRGVIRPTADPLDDYLDPAVVRADREGLESAAEPVLEYANQMVAHRTPAKSLAVRVKDIHRALDAMEPVLQKYFVLMEGRSLVQLEPANLGDDWKDVFTFA